VVAGNEWALREANRIRIETMREHEPGWSETLEETALYLERLGKSALDYVEAWLAFKPSLEAYRRSFARPRRDASPRTPQPQAREAGQGLTVGAGARGGRWFVG
jgi:hypothetical protein